jgi:hypothetical protein
MIANLMFSILTYAARKGVGAAQVEAASKHVARQTGVKGETYAYWYLRRLGYTPVARNYTVAGIKGEIDIVAYDGPVLVFVEVKTRAGDELNRPHADLTSWRSRRLPSKSPWCGCTKMHSGWAPSEVNHGEWYAARGLAYAQ